MFRARLALSTLFALTRFATQAQAVNLQKLIDDAFTTDGWGAVVELDPGRHDLTETITLHH